MVRGIQISQLNVITGTPRSGSTLLCNILNQNPENYASDTSLLGIAVNAITTSISEQLEAQDIDYSQYRDSIKAFIQAWYPQDKIIYDKGRLWSSLGLIYQDLDLGKMFVMVRDLPDVYASMEKHHRKNPLLHGSNIIPSRGVQERAEILCSDTGLIGGAVRGIEDLIRRDLPNVIFIQYEALCADPEKVLKAFDDFEYDFNVKNVSKENDKAYQNKFPHKGEGEVNTKSIGMWRDYLHKDTASAIKATFPFYNERFGY